MPTWLLVAIGLSLPNVLAAQAPAPRPITVGQTVEGQLATTDPALEDGSHYHLYLLRERPGRLVRVTMRSKAVDAYLVAGALVKDGEIKGRTDDDSGGGTDARLRVRVPNSGELAIRANTAGARETGDYTLLVEPIDEKAPEARPIQAGQTLEGRFAEGDPVFDDGSFYHLYRFRGQPGTMVRITMRSKEVDAFLAAGTLTDEGEIDGRTDDDGGGGTDARLRVRVPESGELTIRANTLEAGETGAYSLEVAAVEVKAPEARPVKAGESMQGELAEGDPALEEDGSLYHLYEYRGKPGETVVIELRSDAFDAYLVVGELVNGEFKALDSADDESDQSTDAVIEVKVPESGALAIQANAYAAGETGAYRLTVRVK